MTAEDGYPTFAAAKVSRGLKPTAHRLKPAPRARPGGADRRSACKPEAYPTWLRAAAGMTAEDGYPIAVSGQPQAKAHGTQAEACSTNGLTGQAGKMAALPRGSGAPLADAVEAGRFRPGRRLNALRGCGGGVGDGEDGGDQIVRTAADLDRIGAGGDDMAQMAVPMG